MALKDWKKLGRHKKGFKNWENKKTGDLVVFLESVNPKQPFRVSVHKPTGGISARTISDKQFTSRSKALAYAKKYMRSH